MTQIELAAVEEGPSIFVKARPTASKESKPWHFPLKLLISFVEALGRSSEDFYVYLPLALEPRNREASNP
jgi:hypothetical protein